MTFKRGDKAVTKGMEVEITLALCPQKCDSCGKDIDAGEIVGERDLYWEGVRVYNCPDCLQPADWEAKVERLIAAAKRALNFITNTESEMGIVLNSGNMLKQALRDLGEGADQCPAP